MTTTEPDMEFTGSGLFRQMLDKNPASGIRELEEKTPPDRLSLPARSIDPVSGDRYLLVMLDGSYSVETLEAASMAASTHPDFVVAIPISTLRPILNRSVN